jgi:hypothetical protein
MTYGLTVSAGRCLLDLRLLDRCMLGKTVRVEPGPDIVSSRGRPLIR